MNRWVVRTVGLLMLLLFALVFTQMYKSLVSLQRQQEVQTPTRAR
jgi:hypothetical protein